MNDSNGQKNDSRPTPAPQSKPRSTRKQNGLPREIPVVNMDQLRRMDKREVETLAERFRASRKTAHPREVFATQVKVVTVREHRLKSRRNQLIETADDIARLWPRTIGSAPWYDDQKEHLVVFLVDTQNRLKSYALVTIGSLNETIFSFREIFRPAIAAAAAKIIVAHNHPSGSSAPSVLDSAMTRRLVCAGEVVAISVLDHVIIGAKDCYSFRTSQPSIWWRQSEATHARTGEKQSPKQPSERITRVKVCLPKPLHEKVRAAARSLGISMSELVRLAVRERLGSVERLAGKAGATRVTADAAKARSLRCTNSGLARVGVQVFPRRWLQCKTCREIWCPDIRRGRVSARNWQCPNGCNAAVIQGGKK